MVLSVFSEENNPIPREQLHKAAEALLKVVKTQKKNEILAETCRINLVIAMNRIPSRKMKKVFIPLPHPVFTTSSEICVFTKDVESKDIEKSQEHYEDLFRNKVGFVPKFIPLTSMKKDYKSFEAKLALCGSYDLFLSDARITRLLPPLIGKHFFTKAKNPRDIDLTATDLKKEFFNRISHARWLITAHGDTTMIHAASSNLTAEQIADNLEHCISAVVSQLPRGWSNVRALRIKTNDSIAIPVYINTIEAEDTKVKDMEEMDYIEKNKKRKSEKGLLAPKKKPKIQLRKRKVEPKKVEPKN
nr:ribosomal L1 domain-containing protein 1 [Ciona intestinalis]|eukprot:XP_002123025.3 ribosomal L1 domain-containing protein 1 [Ciona intestinalis]